MATDDQIVPMAELRALVGPKASEETGTLRTYKGLSARACPPTGKRTTDQPPNLLASQELELLARDIIFGRDAELGVIGSLHRARLPLREPLESKGWRTSAFAL